MARKTIYAMDVDITEERVKVIVFRKQNTEHGLERTSKHHYLTWAQWSKVGYLFYRAMQNAQYGKQGACVNVYHDKAGTRIAYYIGS